MGYGWMIFYFIFVGHLSGSGLLFYTDSVGHFGKSLGDNYFGEINEVPPDLARIPLCPVSIKKWLHWNTQKKSG
ncbi:hypothetical protein DM01DRAFT_1337790 [Hesseltinella vesiculosa]|uniref:Uncharacterized protein n=1 Tax=Hesseltinella vesiculosa TaxID=101127 RepID=A0A1X2GBU4_9FUNG|nr:hypothetical protein DM01DRAFT_1337790 [Hesseltinella vesiculosa]